MTPDQVLIKTAILQIILIILKVVFFSFLNMDLWPIIFLYYVLVAGLGIAVVRRFGPINYFEAFLLIIVWLFISLISDYLIVLSVAGAEVLRDVHYWLAYPVIILAILIAHKKIHVEVRRGNMKR